MCWTGPFQLRWLRGYIYNPSYYHHQIGSIHLPIVVVLFHGCMCEMVVLPYSVIYYIYISRTLGPCFNYLCSVCWCSVYGICKRSDTLWPAGRVCLFSDYTISLLSLCRLIWRHWTNKMLVRHMLPSVCLRLRLFSQLSFVQCTGLCVFSLPNSPVMIVRMCTLSYYHHHIGSMNHQPLFRVRPWNNGMRCMSYYVLTCCHINIYCGKIIFFRYIAHMDLLRMLKNYLSAFLQMSHNIALSTAISTHQPLRDLNVI